MNVLLISIPVLTRGTGAPPHDRSAPESVVLRDLPRQAVAAVRPVVGRRHFLRAMSIRAIVTRRSVVADRFAVRTAGRLWTPPFPFKEQQQCASW
ncbi:hypothetical protein [Burkholderia sp. Bp8998]|uniref:hypothetical protein n=1 Tax=Burkholderia sp. Bp8998 TaxID=2184557 RepID=UPI000F5A05F7|nr:hypothetical protein [Burkholderia sp. Bp8998]